MRDGGRGWGMPLVHDGAPSDGLAAWVRDMAAELERLEAERVRLQADLDAATGAPVAAAWPAQLGGASAQRALGRAVLAAHETAAAALARAECQAKEIVDAARREAAALLEQARRSAGGAVAVNAACRCGAGAVPPPHRFDGPGVA